MTLPEQLSQSIAELKLNEQILWGKDKRLMEAALRRKVFAMIAIGSLNRLLYSKPKDK